MRRRFIEHFLHQTRIAMHICTRDISKRIATTALMIVVCWHAGFAKQAIIAGLLVLLFEIIAFFSIQIANTTDRRVKLGFAVWIWAVNGLSVLPFLSFSIILSNSDSLPFILTGYMWAFGLIVHVSNSFGLLPIYNWSLMTPAFGTIFVMFWNLAQNPANDETPLHWLMTSAIMFIYIVNTFDTMTRQKDTHAALTTAREDANTRLAELERLSRNDGLTGLMNRRAFDEKLQTMMRRNADKQQLFLFLIDLDGFKPINDSYSHIAGDAVLCAVAVRLRKMAGKNGYVARLGGDEFALVKSTLGSQQTAHEFGKQIADVIAQPIPYQQKMLTVGASVGIAIQGPTTSTPITLLSGADQAMYSAKQSPEKRAVLYDKSSFPARASLEDRKILINAMRQGQILPYYQPKVCITTNQIMGFEALSRWQHPTRGLLSPREFLPLINDLGLQGEFMMHTAEHVLRDTKALLLDGLNPGQVSINVPEVTLATLSGRAELMELIESYPDLRDLLTFEITEDVFIARSSDIIQQSIACFRRAGIRISLDDFGTGFASFQHLMELEFDELKLDTGFVKSLGIDPAADVLVHGFLTIGSGLGVQIIAEGVENAQQLDLLLGMGCQFVQGHYFGAAIPFAETQLRLSAATGLHENQQHAEQTFIA